MTINFNAIERYNEAFRSRVNEFTYINRERSDFKILIMHLGGVMLECYLKDIIVEKKRIKYSILNNVYWTDDESIEIALAYENVTKSQMKKVAVCQNPCHNIEKAINEIEELQELMVDNEQIKKYVEIIDKPLDDNTYIDLRYKSESEYSDLNDKFQSWSNAFREVFRWIRENKENIEVE